MILCRCVSFLWWGEAHGAAVPWCCWPSSPHVVPSLWSPSTGVAPMQSKCINQFFFFTGWTQLSAAAVRVVRDNSEVNQGISLQYCSSYIYSAAFVWIDLSINGFSIIWSKLKMQCAHTFLKAACCLVFVQNSNILTLMLRQMKNSLTHLTN